MWQSVAGDGVPMRYLNLTSLRLAAGCRLYSLYLHVLVDSCIEISFDVYEEVLLHFPSLKSTDGSMCCCPDSGGVGELLDGCC
jgi:hypothetical protein